LFETSVGPSIALLDRLFGDRLACGSGGYGNSVSSVGGLVYDAKYNRSSTKVSDDIGRSGGTAPAALSRADAVEAPEGSTSMATGTM
jgi:hypothetical protein